MSTGAESSGVVFPPPLVAWGGIGAGWALDRFVFPLPVGLEGAARTRVTLLLGVLCFGVFGWSISRFRRAGTSIRPDRASTTLVTDGPFRYSRNPLYVSILVFQAGAGILLDSVWILMFLVPVALVLHYGVILREERYLERKFGDAYRDYKRAVRRWL